MTPLGWCAFIVTVLVLQTQCAGCWHYTWRNAYDGRMRFQCRSSSYAVTHIQSVHSNYRHDRRFAMGCTRVSHSSCRKSCYWTGWVNSYDRLIHATCRSNHYINGMRSYYYNHYGDRRWRFRCCAIEDRPLRDCVFSGWTNYWKHPQHFKVPRGHVIKGMVSLHSNVKHDRRYEYLVCKLGYYDQESGATTLLESPRPVSQNEAQEDETETTLSDSLGSESPEESLEESLDDPRATIPLKYPGWASVEDKDQEELEDDGEEDEDLDDPQEEPRQTADYLIQ